MLELSEKTLEKLKVLFPGESYEEAKQLLEEECGNNYPFDDCNKYETERIRFAALKISEGNIEWLYEAVILAQTDWRDLLVAAGFGDDVDAHNKWII